MRNSQRLRVLWLWWDAPFQGGFSYKKEVTGSKKLGLAMNVTSLYTLYQKCLTRAIRIWYIVNTINKRGLANGNKHTTNSRGHRSRTVPDYRCAYSDTNSRDVMSTQITTCPDCPNTNLCEHGYCVPHQYSHCKCIVKKRVNQWIMTCGMNKYSARHVNNFTQKEGIIKWRTEP